ncbi:MAG: virulence RhuM family protein [Paludibacteraceae bacterium]|nr:virulence RhuM family protein [Paludibacteraceae bacterium]MBQ9143689.1 virulence RhuM family protein [Paludibacteraceae bacterium]
MANEIVLYQPNEQMSLEVKLENETVWLTQQQIADLFGVKRPAVTKHLGNIFREGELDITSVSSILEHTAADGKIYSTQFYNLDAILSVGYRVNSKNATLFRRWANQVLKEYMLRGYAVNQRIVYVEEYFDKRLRAHEQRIENVEQKIDFFVRTSLPPHQGIFYDGQIFDAYTFINDRIREASTRIILIDNYIDDSVLTILSKRADKVAATIYTKKPSAQLQLDIQKHNAQYTPIDIIAFDRSHDRFLCIDETVYHLGASIKDLGKKWFAFSRMEMPTTELLQKMH